MSYPLTLNEERRPQACWRGPDDPLASVSQPNPICSSPSPELSSPCEGQVLHPRPDPLVCPDPSQGWGLWRGVWLPSACPLRYVSVTSVVWQSVSICHPSIDLELTQAASSPGVSLGGRGLRTAPLTCSMQIQRDTHRMRNLASLQEFFLLGQGRILLGQLPEKHRRELNSARRLPSPPGLAGQGRLRLELAPAFQGPARGGMLPPPPFPCKHGFGWALEAAVKKSGPVWERSRKKRS